ncbi:MAG: metallophosphatase family protein [Firmicutes bacterium]|nr:metallophosphatase family protein [Bacillota bacterium]
MGPFTPEGGYPLEAGRVVRVRAPAWPVHVAVLSDTHVPWRARRLPPGLLARLTDAALVLHAGDLVCEDVLEELGAVAPVLAVAGNMDPPELARHLGRYLLVEVGPWRVGVTHGDLGREGTTVGRALAAFAREGPSAVDVIVFGHSHQPVCSRGGGVLLLNPGSPTDPRREPRPTMGWLTLEGPTRAYAPDGRIILLDQDPQDPGAPRPR